MTRVHTLMRGKERWCSWEGRDLPHKIKSRMASAIVRLRGIAAWCQMAWHSRWRVEEESGESSLCPFSSPILFCSSDDSRDDAATIFRLYLVTISKWQSYTASLFLVLYHNRWTCVSILFYFRALSSFRVYHRICSCISEKKRKRERDTRGRKSSILCTFLQRKRNYRLYTFFYITRNDSN